MSSSQPDFFAVPEPVKAIDVRYHSSSSYAPRTGENARSADVTVAFATDYSTAGEKLTHRMAGSKYISVPLDMQIPEAAQRLADFMHQQHARTLNVAGNGIYTLAKRRLTQAGVNQWVFDVLKLVHADIRLDHIRSGGQTGVDTAGLVAGVALGIPVTGLYPKGFRQRLANQTDVSRSADDLVREIQAAAAALRP